ncbi:MAG TPA: substrate-binding domain-containing protein [Polyangiaceae bacterium]|nr:substrate-binding domain-containing protein [Polyangiaceae bacterium]
MGVALGGARSRIPRIGVVSLWLSGNPYERDVVTGVVDAIEAGGASAVCFAVHGIKDDFDTFIGTESVDGFVLLSASLAQFVGKEALEAFCEKRRSLPIVALGLTLSGVPTIGVDDAGGVKVAVSHLIEAHGRRRIAFIRGPEASGGDIGERFSGYQEALAEHHLAFDPKWVASSSGFGGAGDAIRALLEDSREPPEAIVAFNDATAVAALSALTDRGIRVPQDIAVVGFDDTLDARVAIPPLTTTSQRLEEQGRMAANLVLEALEGKPIPHHVVLDTALVVRRSCGCFPRSVLEIGTGLPSTRRAGDESLAARHAAIAAAVKDVLSPRQVASVDGLLAAFSSDLESGSTHEFLAALDEQLEVSARSPADLMRWEEAISAMRRLTLPCLTGDEALLSRAENLWHQARVLMSDSGQRAQAFLRFSDGQRADALAGISRSLIATRDLPDLIVVLSESLRRFEVKSCYLSLYDAPGSREHSILVLGVDDKDRVSDRVSARFRTSRLVPEGVLPEDRRYTTVVMPLASEDKQLGMILLEGHPNQATAYDKLRTQFGAAFQRMAHERELAALHTALRERVEELERAQEALRENRERLLISESMASLGRLTAGMAHEMNTPLAAVRAALGELLDLIGEYRTSIDGPDVTAEDHRAIAAEMEAATKLADSAAQNVAGFVRGIKAETRDLGAQDLRQFDPLAVTKDTLLLLNHAARAANCTVTLGVASTPMELFGSPGRLAQIVTNLVANAIDASAPKGGGPVVVQLEPSDGAVELRVSDRGTGIAPEDVVKIFEPMYTSKPFGVGTGLGLTIVHDLVTAHFKGTIDVESELGLGTTFILRLSSAG